MIHTLFTLSPSKISNIPLGTLLLPFLNLWYENTYIRPKDNKIQKFASKANINFESMGEALRRINEISHIMNKKG